MKLLSLLLSIILLTGCYPNQYQSMIYTTNAFREICDLNTVTSSIIIEGETVVLKSTCIKAK